MASASTHAALADVTVDNADALDCGVCCLPLKPPIFQCTVGHVICSPCRDKLAAARRCHVCRTPTSGGYHRNHGMEKLLESIRAPCSNAAYGCAGSTSKLLDQFVTVHRWTCSTQLRSLEPVELHLRDGFNVASVHAGGQQYLFLLNVVPNPFGRGISILCVHPRAPIDESSPAPPRTAGLEVRLKYSNNNYGSRDICCGHSQETKFKVACTDLSNGLPDSDDSCQFFLPKCVHPFDIDTIIAEFDVVKVFFRKGNKIPASASWST